MYMPYVGLNNSAGSRIYTSHVIDPPRERREFTVKIQSEEFRPGRLRFQDGPGISSARLQQELKVETQESRAEPHMRIEEHEVREYRAQHYPQQKLPKATDVVPGLPPGSSPANKHFQDHGYWPLGPTRLPKSEEISTLLLHEPGDSLDALKLALEAQSVKVCSLQSCQEALPLLTGPNPPHLIFTQPKLPDGIWADVVKVAARAPKSVNVIVVARLADVRLYLETITRGAFDFIVPPMTSHELAHVLACAVESVLDLRRTQAAAADA
jgi:ActR/RegA family two-component response regulator